MMNDPINHIDPDGRAAEWIPEIKTDGSVSYIAEAGDSAQTLSEQYGISQETAEAITGTTGNTEIKEGTSISGEKVADVIGSDVLKLDYNSKMATDQRKFDQLLFANDYSRLSGDTGYYPNDFFNNLPLSSEGFTLKNVNYSFEGNTYLVKAVSIVANGYWNWKIQNNIGRSSSSWLDKDGTYSVNLQVYKDGGKSNFKIPVIYFKTLSHQANTLQDRIQSKTKIK